MSCYDWLIGQCFMRNGTTLTVVECDGATVVASRPASGQPETVRVSLAEVLELLEVPEVTVTELPRSRHDVSRV